MWHHRCVPFRFNTDMPDGMPRKLLGISRVAELGWTARISLEDAIRRTYDSYVRGAGGRGPGARSRAYMIGVEWSVTTVR
jgi:hypothetical protein